MTVHSTFHGPRTGRVPGRRPGSDLRLVVPGGDRAPAARRGHLALVVDNGNRPIVAAVPAGPAFARPTLRTVPPRGDEPDPPRPTRTGGLQPLVAGYVRVASAVQRRLTSAGAGVALAFFCVLVEARRHAAVLP